MEYRRWEWDKGGMVIGGMAKGVILGHPGAAHAVEESRLVVRLAQKVVDNLGGGAKSSRFYAAIICP
eukprot:COSAG01_NODE_37647_length_500_cov_7.905237_1_plen_67_part_00